MYKLTDSGGVVRLDSSIAIPADRRNVDWREYLAWRAEGNTPMAADSAEAPAVDPGPPVLPSVAKVVGVQAGAASKAVGPVWGKVFWAAIAFDHFPALTASVNAVVHAAGVPNGNFLIRRDGIYRFRAQIYVAPPESAGAKISMYLGLTDRGVDGSGSALLHVANEEFPGGQHPSLSLECLVKHVGQRYYSFDWYYLDGAGITPTMNLQTGGQYCFASLESVR